jgi:transcription initiation factor IIF auxiliary subunit
MFGEGLALTPTLSRRERGLAPFALREKGWG